MRNLDLKLLAQTSLVKLQHQGSFVTAHFDGGALKLQQAIKPKCVMFCLFLALFTQNFLGGSQGRVNFSRFR